MIITQFLAISEIESIYIDFQNYNHFNLHWKSKTKLSSCNVTTNLIKQWEKANIRLKNRPESKRVVSVWKMLCWDLNNQHSLLDRLGHTRGTHQKVKSLKILLFDGNEKILI